MLAHASMWGFFGLFFSFFVCRWRPQPSQLSVPESHERCCSIDLWPFYSVAVWLLKSAWMSNLHGLLSSFLLPVFSVLSSTVTGQSTAGLWTPTPLLRDTVSSLDLWRRAAGLKWGWPTKMGGETDFTGLQLFGELGVKKKTTTLNSSVLYCHLAAVSCCGCNHWWREQPEVTAWSPHSIPVTPGVATLLKTAHLDVLWMCQF